jgi:hypothetical protein
MPSSFDDIIREHLDLKRRNSRLEESLPISQYLGAAGTQPGAVFDAEKVEEGAAFDTAEWKGKRKRAETFLESLEDVWSSGPVFDWGDEKRR